MTLKKGDRFGFPLDSFTLEHIRMCSAMVGVPRDPGCPQQAGAPIAGELTAVTICELAMEGNITKIRTLVAIHPPSKPQNPKETQPKP